MCTGISTGIGGGRRSGNGGGAGTAIGGTGDGGGGDDSSCSDGTGSDGTGDDHRAGSDRAGDDHRAGYRTYDSSRSHNVLILVWEVIAGNECVVVVVVDCYWFG